MAEIVIDVGGHELVSAITAGSAERLALAEGQEVTAIIKATKVLRSTDA
jgi:molybdopterin-binding protein